MTIRRHLSNSHSREDFAIYELTEPPYNPDADVCQAGFTLAGVEIGGQVRVFDAESGKWSEPGAAGMELRGNGS